MGNQLAKKEAIKSCHLYYLGQNEKSFSINELVQQLEKSCGQDCPPLGLIPTQSLEELIKSAVHSPPHAIFVDEKFADKKTELVKLIRSLKESDPHLCLIFLSEKSPNTNEIMDYLDMGFVGVLNKTVSPKESFSDSLLEVLQKRFLKEQARRPRIDSQHKVKVLIPSFEQAICAETLNIGTGGMFVRLNPKDLKEGDLIDFEVELSDGEDIMQQRKGPQVKKADGSKIHHHLGENHIFCGTGKVVWIRPYTTDLPEGIGLQFVQVNEEDQVKLYELVKRHKIRAFIPKN